MNANQHPFEDLSADALKDLSAYEHPFDDTRTARIAARFAQKTETACIANIQEMNEAKDPAEERPSEIPHRRSGRLIALLAAAALIVLAGFTNADRIQELFVSYFGGGADVAKQAQPIGASAADQGIRADVVAAINEGKITYVVVDLQDTTGDRLTDNLHFEAMSLLGSDSHGYTEETLSYNPETKTSTLMIQGDGLKAGETATLSLSGIYANKTEHSVVAEELNLADLLNQGGTFESIDWMAEGGLSGGASMEFVGEGRDINDVDEVLARDEMHIDIPGLDTGYLSNIAYRDGMLHVQMNPADEVSNGWEAAQLFNLIDIRTGEEVGGYYGVGYGPYTSPKKNITYVASDYREEVFRIDEADLPYYRLHVFGHSFDTFIDGSWEVSFTVPERTEVLSTDANVPLPNMGEEFIINAAEVSPLSVRLSFTYAAANDTDNVNADVRLVYRDGSKVSLANAPRNGTSIDLNAQEGVLVFVSPIENFDDLIALEIEGTTVALREE